MPSRDDDRVSLNILVNSLLPLQLVISFYITSVSHTLMPLDAYISRFQR